MISSMMPEQKYTVYCTGTKPQMCYSRQEAMQVAEDLWIHTVQWNPDEFDVLEVRDSEGRTIRDWITAGTLENGDWVFPDCRVYRKGKRFHVVVEGEEGLGFVARCVVVLSKDIEKDIAALDSGSSPIADRWDDGNGNVVSFELGVPCDDEGNIYGNIFFRWNGKVYSVYDQISDDDTRTVQEYCSESLQKRFGKKIPEQNILGVDLELNAKPISNWAEVDDYPNESIEEFLQPMIGSMSIREQVKVNKGDYKLVADQFVYMFFQQEDGVNADAVRHNRIRLLEQYHMSVSEFRGWMCAYISKVSSTPTEITAVLKVAQHGNALVVSCTKEMSTLDLGRGDLVKVTFKRLD